MFEKESIIALLENIGKALPSKVSVYMIGGGALSLRDLKEATKDVDVVVLDRTSIRLMKGALEKIGYEVDPGLFKEQFYKDAVFVFLDKSGSRIDLLTGLVCGMLRLSEAMQKRASRYGAFGNLELHLVSNEDILLFKAVTDRPQDLVDIRALIDATQLDWEGIIRECVAQHRKETRWIFWFYEQLCRLEDSEGIPIPQKARIFEVCLENWDKHPGDWMGEFNPAQLKRHLPEKHRGMLKK